MKRPIALLVFSSLLLAACDGVVPWASRCPAPLEPMARGELILGRNIGATEAVGDEDLREFLDREVTTRFADGFTVQDGAGQWRDTASAGIVRERAKVLTIIMRNDGEGRRRLQAVADAYKARFKQQSVLMVMTPVCAAF